MPLGGLLRNNVPKVTGHEIIMKDQKLPFQQRTPSSNFDPWTLNGVSGQNYYNASNCDNSLTICHAELNLYRTTVGQKLEAGKGVG